MSSILPKGIVVNTPEISGDIQKIDREPLALEEIAKFWKGKRANGLARISLSLIDASLYHHEEKTCRPHSRTFREFLVADMG
jgi:hypothetical protein